MFERKLKAMVEDGQDPLQNVAEKLSEFDLVIANFETALFFEEANDPLPHKLFRLSSPVEGLDVLLSANIKTVNLANNHTMDYGPRALLKELKLLDKKGIKHFGAGKNLDDAFAPLIIDTEDGRIALLGFNRVETHRTKADPKTAGQAFFKEPERMEEAIRLARESADVVIVCPHWGKEYSFTPSEKQVYFGMKFIEWGADLVVGNHPHVFQGNIEYKGKPIYYSLGNFCFSSNFARPGTLEGQTLEVTIDGKAVSALKLHKVWLEESGIPHMD